MNSWEPWAALSVGIFLTFMGAYHHSANRPVTQGRCVNGHHVFLKEHSVFVAGDPLCECGYITANCDGHTTERGSIFFHESSPIDPPLAPRSEEDEDYRRWQRAAEAPTVYSRPIDPPLPQGEPGQVLVEFQEPLPQARVTFLDTEPIDPP